MLAKKFRLPSEAWLTQRQKTPLRVVANPLFTLRTYKNDALHMRVGVVISVKIDKRATVRNRIRRTIVDCFMPHLNKLPAIDYIYIVRPNITTADRAAIIKEIEKTIL